MGVQEQGWLMNIVRDIFSFLDGLVYGLIKWILFGIFDLANVTTNSAVFSSIYSRLYVILGIFMAFKLSFSFFQYIIDPESMTGKSEKSLSKVFSRVFIMLAALIFLPSLLFSGIDGKGGILYRAQTAFLPTLPKIIFGVDNLGGLSTSSGVGTGSNFSDSVEQAANDITVTILKGFFAPPEDLDNYCDDGTFANTPQITSIEDFRRNVNLDCAKRGDILAHIDITGLGSATGLASKFYRYSYMWFISTVVGVLVALLLLAITFDIAKRVFKLMILEVIAPIPIMSLVDPKGSKDGAFRKWVSSLTSTFLDIFFKLGIVYLIIVFIHLIVNSGSEGGLFKNFPENAGFRGTYLTILLILGLILFAKEAPKFIKESLGLKGDSGGLLDDVKTVGKAAGLVGGAAVGAAGVVGSTVGSVRAQMEGNKEHFEGQHLRNAGRNLMAGVSGLIGGTAAGVKGLTGKNAGVGSVMKNQQDRNAADFDRRRHGGTFFGGVGSDLRQAFTGETSYAAEERKWKQQESDIKSRELALKPMQDANAHRKAIMDRIKSKVGESLKTTGSYKGYTGNYREYNSAFTAAKSGVGLHTAYSDSFGNVISESAYNGLTDAQKASYTSGTYFTFNGQEVDMAQAESIGMGLMDSNSENYYAKAFADENFDSAITSEIDLFNSSGLTDENGNPIYMESTLGGEHGIKAEYGRVSKTISGRSSQINKDKEALNNAQVSRDAQRKKANSGGYRAKK